MHIALAPPQASPPLQLRSRSRQDPDEQVKGVGMMTQFGKGVREVVIRPLRISFIERQLQIPKSAYRDPGKRNHSEVLSAEAHA